jgi:hypothetical protein
MGLHSETSRYEVRREREYGAGTSHLRDKKDAGDLQPDSIAISIQYIQPCKVEKWSTRIFSTDNLWHHVTDSTLMEHYYLISE